MLTTLSKVFTVFVVVLSISALGIGIYTFADETDYDARQRDLVDKIRELETNRERERLALGAVLDQLTKGDRPVAFNAETPLDKSAQPKSVAETKLDIESLKRDIDTVINQRNQLQVDVASLLNELDRLRGQTREELKTQRELREQIRSDAPGVRPFRALIEDAKVVKDEAQRRKDALHPVLVHEVMRLMALMRQNETLTTRDREIQGGN